MALSGTLFLQRSCIRQSYVIEHSLQSHRFCLLIIDGCWCSSFLRVPGNIIRKWAKDKRNEGVLQLVFRAISLQCYIFVSVYHILLLHIFHDVNVVWLCESELITTYDTFQDTVAAITLESGTHI